jgi:5-methylcytosine-specific restriction endonuclease McrA
MSRKGYEFSSRIKGEEKRRWRKRNPGREDESLEVHHILPIYKAKEYDVPKEAVRSQQNAVAVDSEFHKKVHKETDEETYSVLAQGLRGLWAKLF